MWVAAVLLARAEKKEKVYIVVQLRLHNPAQVPVVKETVSGTVQIFYSQVPLNLFLYQQIAMEELCLNSLQ